MGDAYSRSNTTAKVALEPGHSAVGSEINEKFIDIIKGKLEITEDRLTKFHEE